MIVIVQKNDKGEIVVTEKQLEKWLKKAEDDGYNRGYTQGLNDAKPTLYPNTITTPSITLKDAEMKEYGYTLTCKGASND